MFKNLDAIISKWSKGEKTVAAIFIPLLIFAALCVIVLIIGNIDTSGYDGETIIGVSAVLTLIISFPIEMRIFKNF